MNELIKNVQERSMQMFHLLNGLSPEGIAMLLCMTIDTAGGILGMTGAEMLDMIKPAIDEVNNKLGGIDFKGVAE